MNFLEINFWLYTFQTLFPLNYPPASTASATG